MDELTNLERQIREKLAGAEAKRRDRQAALTAEMQAREKLVERFNGEARRWMQALIVPRMERLAACFENAKFCPPDAIRPFRCACTFERTPQFPATTTLEMTLFPEESLDNGVVAYAVEILPILFQFERKDQLVVALDKPDDDRIAEWVERKLMTFLDAYLQLPEAEHYQRDNLVIDPVCGMEINKQFAAASEELLGKTYYFCVEECRRKFLEDTARYSAPAAR